MTPTNSSNIFFLHPYLRKLEINKHQLLHVVSHIVPGTVLLHFDTEFRSCQWHNVNLQCPLHKTNAPKCRIHWQEFAPVRQTHLQSTLPQQKSSDCNRSIQWIGVVPIRDPLVPCPMQVSPQKTYVVRYNVTYSAPFLGTCSRHQEAISKLYLCLRDAEIEKLVLLRPSPCQTVTIWLLKGEISSCFVGMRCQSHYSSWLLNPVDVQYILQYAVQRVQLMKQLAIKPFFWRVHRVQLKSSLGERTGVILPRWCGLQFGCAKKLRRLQGGWMLDDHSLHLQEFKAITPDWLLFDCIYRHDKHDKPTQHSMAMQNSQSFWCLHWTSYEIVYPEEPIDQEVHEAWGQPHHIRSNDGSIHLHGDLVEGAKFF